MDITLQKVTMDPKRVEAAPKGRKNYMNKLKKSFLNDARKGSGDTTNASNETASATNTATTPATSTNNTTTTRSSDERQVYIDIKRNIDILAIHCQCFLSIDDLSLLEGF